MTASLPMYETAPMRAPVDRFWQSIRAKYGQGADRLDRKTDPHVTWLAPDLVLSQTCGLPYRSVLSDKVQLVGTPDYGLPDCPPGYYRSHLIARADDPRHRLDDFAGARLARNDVRSQSGWAAVVTHAAEKVPGFRFSEDIADTGSHLNSLKAVREQQADIASVDAVTWSLLDRDTTETRGLIIIESTLPSPGLPFITAPRQNVQALRAAIREAIAELTPEDRALLLIRDLVWIPPETYHAVPTPSE